MEALRYLYSKVMTGQVAAYYIDAYDLNFENIPFFFRNLLISSSIHSLNPKSNFIKAIAERMDLYPVQALNFGSLDYSKYVFHIRNKLRNDEGIPLEKKPKLDPSNIAILNKLTNVNLYENELFRNSKRKIVSKSSRTLGSPEISKTSQERFVEIQDVTEKIDNLLDQVDKEAFEKQIADFKRTIAEKETNYQTLKQEFDDAVQEKTLLNEQNNTLQKDFQKLYEEKKSEIEKMQTKLDDTNLQLEDKKLEIETVRTKYTNMIGDYDQVKEDKKKLEDREKELRKELSKLKEDKSKLITEIKKMKDEK